MLDLAAWSAGGRSVRGTRHERAGAPNQDAIATACGAVALVAVADGHGSSHCTRSDVGARIAVDVARSVLPAFATDARDLAAVRAALANDLVSSWRARVRDDLAVRPLDAAEAARVDGPPVRAYGATLVAAVASGDTILAVQIGDGDAWLAHDRRTCRLVPRDLRFALNGTASLCMAEAAHEVRVARVTVERPALVLLATDGYGRTLATDADFAASLRAVYDRVRTLGLDAALDVLPVDLAGASAQGGDDVTVGIVYRA
jgi:hypothetical protein